MHDLQHGGTTVEVETGHFVHAKHTLGEVALIELSSSKLQKDVLTTSSDKEKPAPPMAGRDLLGSDSSSEAASSSAEVEPAAVAVSDTHSNPQSSLGPASEPTRIVEAPTQPTSPLTVSEVTDAVDENIDGRLGRLNNFQDFLKAKPIVQDALDAYKDGVADVKRKAGNVYEGMGGLVDGMSRLHDEVGGVEKETGNLKRATETETRESATNSVGAFTTYNHDGVFGSDDTGLWKPDAGKWDAFKSFLVEGQAKLEERAKAVPHH